MPDFTLGDGTYSNSTAMPEDTLTMEKLSSVYRSMHALEMALHLVSEPTAPLMSGWANLWNPAPPPMMGSIPIRTSTYLGDKFTPEPPVMKKGPYYQRRILRWRRHHPPYTAGNEQYFLVDRKEIFCHPDH